MENSNTAAVIDAPKPAPASDVSEPIAVTGKPTPTAAAGREKQAEESGKFSARRAGKILLYVLLAAAAIFVIKYYFFTPPTVPVAQVRRQDYTGEVQGTGTVNVDVVATVGAKIPGRLDRVLVDEGDFVHSGQVVATIEDTDIRQVLQRSQARLESARMTEQSSQSMERSSRQMAQSSREMAESRRATKYQTERAWQREKHLVATGAVSQEEADQYEERDRTAASAVGAADADVGAAQAKIEAAGAELQAAHSEIASSDAEVRLQQFNLSQTKIFTYVNGVVIDRPKRAGDAIVSGETVLTIADPKVILVEAYLDQRLAGKISPGQIATVVLRGRTKEPIQGRVYRLRPQADPAAEEMTVEISFPLAPSELQIGQWADVYVQVNHASNALVLPKSAVMTMGDGRYALVVGADNRVRRVDIETLASSPQSQVIAVTGDLKAGDWVLTQPMGIPPGKKVHPTQTTGAVTPDSKSSNPAMKM